ncbi:MAG TPA: hypothetical protein VHD69_02755 [Candidatus Paceibacterota bacterium]|nr:hypothetical protein [Candidatus Paceibacterota bacterium]
MKTRTLADLGVGPRETAFDRVARFFATRMTAKLKLCLAIAMVPIGMYVTLGLMRCAWVASHDDPGIVYSRTLDWWWLWLFS